jgi:hypothetical protein
MNAKDVARAIKAFRIDPEKANPVGGVSCRASPCPG